MIAQPEIFVKPDGYTSLDSGEIIHKITKREKEVLLKLAEGLTVKEVASVLYVAPSTIVTHKKNIYEKLKARTMVQLGVMAVRSGIIAL